MKLIQLPIVAGFIPSLPWGLPFRVSIHSWETPRIARPVPQTAQQDVVSLFEARVIVDGCCIACVLQLLRTRLWAHSHTELGLTGLLQCYLVQSSNRYLAASHRYQPYCLLFLNSTDKSLLDTTNRMSSKSVIVRV